MMNMSALRQGAAQALELLPEVKPEVALILGSGWGDVASSFGPSVSIDYGQITPFGSSQVHGHPGKLSCAACEGRDILIFQGRRHWYEGEGWEPVVFPVYLAKALGAQIVFLTNAAGGINPTFRPGDLMLIEDHINAMGTNPLVGAHDPEWGSRFPDQTEVYDRCLRTTVRAVAAELEIELRTGIYVATSGPVYETPAEIEAYRLMNGDAVGMSTVPEAMVAHAAGLRVVAVSCITNLGAGMHPDKLSHRHVLEATESVQPRMSRLLHEFVRRAIRRS
jgi:purine-nucleoside phosphorylase